MNILYAASEAAPFSKTGGLADVAGSLPKALKNLGHDTRIVMPLYGAIDRDTYNFVPAMDEIIVHFPEGDETGRVLRTQLPDSDVTVYAIEHPEFFDRVGLYQGDGVDYKDNPKRFAFFCQAALWLITGIGWKPDVILCNDWQTGLIPVYLRGVHDFRASEAHQDIKLLYTVHNLAYQGLADPEWLEILGLPEDVYHIDGLEFYGQINLMKGGIAFADRVTAVSPRYAREIQTEQFGCGLDGILRLRSDRVHGILNGIDTDEWDPATDSRLTAHYSIEDMSGKAKCKERIQRRFSLPEESDTPLIGVISRLTDQKGFDIILEAAPSMFDAGAQFVLLGTGERKYEVLYNKLRTKYPGQAGVEIGFDNDLAHEIEAGADMFLMPSRFEPCGLNQLYSLRYGTIPIVRKVGGLADTVVDATPETISDGRGTGFVFEPYASEDLWRAIQRAIQLYNNKPDQWNRLRRNAMQQDFSWSASARRYVDLIERMLNE